MKQVQENSLVRYILSDQVWWCNVKQFLSYSKNYICKFMQVNSWHKLFHFHLSFWIWKVWKGREKTTKIWVTQERKEESLFLDSVTTPRCYKDVYVNGFFPCTARLWNSVPIECIPLTYDLSGFKYRINRHLLTVGSF